MHQLLLEVLEGLQRQEGRHLLRLGLLLAAGETREHERQTEHLDEVVGPRLSRCPPPLGDRRRLARAHPASPYRRARVVVQLLQLAIGGRQGECLSKRSEDQQVDAGAVDQVLGKVLVRQLGADATAALRLGDDPLHRPTAAVRSASFEAVDDRAQRTG